MRAKASEYEDLVERNKRISGVYEKARKPRKKRRGFFKSLWEKVLKWRAR